MMPLQRTASYVTPENFNSSLLISATEENNTTEIKNQLEIWRNANNVSVFVQWIPDELTESDASLIFSEFGIIERVDIVNKMANGEKIGRMMFVHFSYWMNSSLSDNITQNYPEPHNLDWNSYNKYGNMKKYILKCRINLRPIAPLEYNCVQLTDMIETLKSEMCKLREMVEYLADENQRLNVDMEIMKTENDKFRSVITESVFALENAVDPEQMLKEQYRLQG